MNKCNLNEMFFGLVVFLAITSPIFLMMGCDNSSFENNPNYTSTNEIAVDSKNGYKIYVVHDKNKDVTCYVASNSMTSNPSISCLQVK